MKPLQIFGNGTASRSPNVTSQSLVNMYLEHSDDKSTVVAYGTPGLTLFANLGAGELRGMASIAEKLYVVSGAALYKVDNAGVYTSLGALLTSTGRVDICDNGLDVVVVDGTYGYRYTISTGVFVRITDVDFPGADTCAFNDGYIIVNKPSSGQFWLSSSYAAGTWVATEFATAESSPDNLLRVFVDHGQLLLLGKRTTEFWGDSGAEDFPYTRVSGVVSEYGIAAVWSLAKFKSTVIMLGKNALGNTQVVMLNGYNFIPVSTPDIESLFQTYSAVSDASGFSYVKNGHDFYQLNFTTAGKSWLYDGTMNIWSELKSGYSRHRAEMACNHNGSTYVGDYDNSKVYLLDETCYTDNGTALISEIITKHVFSNLERVKISALQVDMETGVGLSTGDHVDPQIMLQISRDGGHAWGPEKWSTIGKIGEYAMRTSWNRLGMSRDWTFKLSISAAVKRVIMGVYIS